MLQQSLGVKCIFKPNGRLQIQRIEQNGRWRMVEQGRQWQDESGMHVLVMLDQRAHQLTLSAETLTWQLAPTQRAAVA